MKILFISGHPRLHSGSVANKAILDVLEKEFPQAEFRYLDRLYPDFKINVEAEQNALLEADLIVWQFPFFWYAAPSLMKIWEEDVLTHGFAYGSTAKLGGKKLLVSFTTGTPASAYTGKEGSVANMEALLTIFKSISTVCNLDYQGAMYINGVFYIPGGDQEVIEKQRVRAVEYAQTLVKRIHEIESQK